MSEDQNYVVNPISGRLVKVGSTRYKTLASLGVFNEKKKPTKFSVTKDAKNDWETQLINYIDRQSKIEPVHDVIKPIGSEAKPKKTKPLPPPVTPNSSSDDESDDESDEDEDESEESD